MRCSDSLGFLSLQGASPVADPRIAEYMELIHATAAPPFIKDSTGVLREVLDFAEWIRTQECLSLASMGSEEKTGIIMGLQNLPDDLAYPMFVDLVGAGVQIFSLAHNEQNAFGSGYYCPSEGIKPRGLEVLKWCYEHSMIVDISHASHQMARDVLYYADGELRIIASHGGCYSVFPSNRNLPDDVLRGVAEQGGVVGVYTLTFGLHESDNSLAPFVRHTKHALKICGEDGVCAGTDGRYKTLEEERWRQCVTWLKKKVDTQDELAVRWPDDPLVLNEAGPRRMRIIAEALKSGGISERIVEKVLTNFARFLWR